MKIAEKNISISALYAPVRVCADMSFYFYALALLSLTVAYYASSGGKVYGVITNITSPWALQIGVLLVSSFALGFLTVHIKSAPLRFVISLLPGLSFLMNPFRPVFLVHAAAWAYYVIYMTIGNFEEYLDVYRRRIKLMLIMALVLTGLLIIFRFSNDAWYGSKLLGGEEYGLFFFVLAVASLRGMRLGFGATGRLRAMDTAFVVALPVLLTAAVLLFSGAVPVITYLFKQLTRVLAYLYSLLFPQKETPDISQLPDEDGGLPAETPIIDPNAVKEDIETEPIDGEDPHIRVSSNTLFWILIVILIVFLVIIAVRLLRSKRSDPVKSGRAHERIERIPFEGLRHRRSADTALSANVRQIRKIYRVYLEQVFSRHARLGPSDTSRDVLDLSEDFSGLPENKTLREIYIAARYGDPDVVTSEQTAEARRCLNTLLSARSGAAQHQ
ncbi:MAG: hypothetical protein IKR16_00325 [Firmicutes bacterium]|nr:hypothetical protein [Bacillota bacterium]